jgi:hypothetical protein
VDAGRARVDTRAFTCGSGRLFAYTSDLFLYIYINQQARVGPDDALREVPIRDCFFFNLDYFPNMRQAMAAVDWSVDVLTLFYLFIHCVCNIFL